MVQIAKKIGPYCKLHRESSEFSIYVERKSVKNESNPTVIEKKDPHTGNVAKICFEENHIIIRLFGERGNILSMASFINTLNANNDGGENLMIKTRGINDGPSEIWDEGCVIESFNYEKGSREGEALKYYPGTSTISHRCFYKKDKLHGQWERYDVNGNVLESHLYENGKEILE